MTKKKFSFNVGDVFAIALPSGGYAFGLVCAGLDFAFFKQRVDSPVMPKKIQDIELAFRVPVALDAPGVGKWMFVGHEAPEGDLAESAKYFHKAIGSSDCYIYSAGKEVLSDCETTKHLEVLSTWFSFHVEERLEDCLLGRENRYVLAIKQQLEI
jgi:hypothetical protein